MEIMKYERSLQLSGDYGVIVAGSGPSGICAAIAAARQGVKVAIIERYGVVGGNLTSGCVGPIMGSVSKGTLRDELTYRLSVDSNDMLGWEGRVHDIDFAKGELLNFLNEEGVDVFLQTPIVDTISDNGKIKGVVISTKEGLTVLKSDVTVDATGDGDVAFLAGAEYQLGRESDSRLQPVTLMYVLSGVDDSKAIICIGEADTVPFNGEPFPKFTQRCCDNGLLPENTGAVRLYPTVYPGERLVNTTQVNDIIPTKTTDVTKAELILRKQINEINNFLRKYVPGYENCKVKYSANTLGVRESRRFTGDYSLTVDDIRNGKRQQDVVVHSANFCIDIHNPAGSGQAESFDKVFDNKAYDIPYRCLLPRRVDNLLLTGRCISGTHHAHASYRVMSICMALGEASGIAAALSAKQKVTPRELDYKLIQNELIKIGVN